MNKDRLGVIFDDIEIGQLFFISDDMIEHMCIPLHKPYGNIMRKRDNSSAVFVGMPEVGAWEIDPNIHVWLVIRQSVIDKHSSLK